MDSRWISVSESLPAEREDVFIAVVTVEKFHDVILGYYGYRDCWYDTRACDEDGHDIVYGRVTHWHPIDWPAFPDD